ncbi:MAG: 1-deoxy-D-xylulose-5-phosphate synthase, partial [Candidatus Omnitrophica bacterium]|nr:1-deoxy-D-xylulose-5-phosphate synthase [Candidatus Omnitrophota bacterium]
ARFIKPLDIDLFKRVSEKVKFVFSVEEGILEGGFGSAISEATNSPVIKMGLPCAFIAHGKRDSILDKYGLTSQGIADKIKSSIHA